MRIIPYTRPLVPQYRSKHFKKLTIYYKTKLEKIFFQDNRFLKKLQDCWVYFIPNQKAVRSKKNGKGWTVKLYVCVGAPHYWKLISNLVKKSNSFKNQWKFYMAPNGYERPDKIVFYFKSNSELKSFVKKIRPLIPKTKLHNLSHTASTASMMMEQKKNGGLYVGIDPPINESWRMYRAYCIAWGNLNKDYLNSLIGGKKLWFRRMNLSDKHDGPYSLNPSPKNDAYVQRYWRIIKQ